MSYIDLRSVQVQDASGVTINPAQDETVILLRRLVQIAQTLGVTDSAQRQRVAVETMPTTAVTISSGTVTTVNQFAGVDVRYQMVDWARTAYNTGIRANLINT